VLQQIVGIQGAVGGITVRMQIVEHVAAIIRTRCRPQSLAANV
jgi:hypothetical protein